MVHMIHILCQLHVPWHVHYTRTSSLHSHYGVYYAVYTMEITITDVHIRHWIIQLPKEDLHVHV